MTVEKRFDGFRREWMWNEIVTETSFVINIYLLSTVKSICKVHKRHVWQTIEVGCVVNKARADLHLIIDTNSHLYCIFDVLMNDGSDLLALALDSIFVLSAEYENNVLALHNLFSLNFVRGSFVRKQSELVK